MAPINGTQLGKQVPPQTNPPTTNKSSNICDHPKLLDQLICTAEDNDNKIPLNSFLGPNVNDVISQYNMDETNPMTFTGSPRDLTKTNEQENPSWLRFLGGGILVKANEMINPIASTAKLQVTQEGCAEKAAAEVIEPEHCED